MNVHNSLPSLVRNTIKSPSTSVEALDNMCGDGTNTEINPRNSTNGCKLCPRFSTKDHFVSSSTYRVHRSIIPDNSTTINCNCSNVIYLITCKRCELQYVGETAQLLRVRIGKHASCMNHPEKDNTCRILSEDFNEVFVRGLGFLCM